MSVSEMQANAISEAKEKVNRVSGLLFGALVDAKQAHLEKLIDPKILSSVQVADIAFNTASKFIRELSDSKQFQLIEKLVDPKSEESNLVIGFLRSRGETENHAAVTGFAISFVAKNFKALSEDLKGASRQ